MDRKDIKMEKEFGYPPEKYIFTGNFSLDTGSAQKIAMRNRLKRYLPIYQNQKGEIVCDATQALKPTEIKLDIEKGSIVDFVDETGKTKIGEVIRKVKRGRSKGWYKIKSHKNGKEKTYTVDEVRVAQNDGIS